MCKPLNLSYVFVFLVGTFGEEFDWLSENIPLKIDTGKQISYLYEDNTGFTVWHGVTVEPEY